MDSHTSIPLNDHCSVALQRTLRIPDDGRDYPLPPGLGAISAYEAEPGDFIVPMRRSEALWLSFRAPYWKPHVLKVGIGGIDAISGEEFDPRSLNPDPQDYVVIPAQPWLDGINCGDGFIRQFVAVPLGDGSTVEGQLTGKEEQGGLTLSLFEPYKGIFPEEPPVRRSWSAEYGAESLLMACSDADSMGLAAGGRMRQEIYDDEHGIKTWKKRPTATAEIELVDALAFEALTGIGAQGPAIDAETYTRFGFPWFDLIAPTRRDIAASERLASVRSLADLEGRREGSLPIPDAQVRRLLSLRELVG